MCRHSLGGALAQLAAFDLESDWNDYEVVSGVYTFGGPRVGDQAWTEAYEKVYLTGKTIR